MGFKLQASRTPLGRVTQTVGVWEKWTPASLANIILFLGICFAATTLLPQHFLGDYRSQPIFGIFGVIALWRFSWWLCHLIRAKIYQHVRYPALAQRATAAWQSGWRPRQLHFLITVYKEQPETLKAVLLGICQELRSTRQKATLWIGSKVPEDENLISGYLASIAADLDIELKFVRQPGSGKRNALGLVLRAMAQHGLGSDDCVAFMDSDFVLHPGVLVKCLPLFACDPELHALTTDEECVVNGPAWMSSWLDMRFAQRRIAMQSHALSKRVLTLTGRFSVFRGTHVVSRDFISIVENDHLDHWLWGRFTFLSGDDKSTWYALLKRGGNMLYVPDASGYTIEIIEGSAASRMIQNLLRWSGNMLRSGSRAIALGPRKMPWFIWWCLVDQRFAMWTMLFGSVCAIVGTLTFGPPFLLAFVIYVALSRLALSLVLFHYSKRVDLNFVWCLYANQILNSAIKLYLLWRLPRQRWSNRGNQVAGMSGGGLIATIRNVMAIYLTSLSLSMLLISALVTTSILTVPRNVAVSTILLTPWAK